MVAVQLVKTGLPQRHRVALGLRQRFFERRGPLHFFKERVASRCCCVLLRLRAACRRMVSRSLEDVMRACAACLALHLGLRQSVCVRFSVRDTFLCSPSHWLVSARAILLLLTGEKHVKGLTMYSSPFSCVSVCPCSREPRVPSRSAGWPSRRSLVMWKRKEQHRRRCESANTQWDRPNLPARVF